FRLKQHLPGAVLGRHRSRRAAVPVLRSHPLSFRTCVGGQRGGTRAFVRPWCQRNDFELPSLLAGAPKKSACSPVPGRQPTPNTVGRGHGLLSGSTPWEAK